MISGRDLSAFQGKVLPPFTWVPPIRALIYTGPWDPPNLLYKGYRVFPGSKVAEEWR